MDCMICGRDGSFLFRALEVETLPVRDLKGEKKVQALREFHDFCVCEDCARQQLDGCLHPGKKTRLRVALFAALLLFGAALTVIFWRTHGALRLMGLSACFLGIVGIGYTVRTAKQRRAEYAALSEADALSRAAWERVVGKAPKKRGDSNLTYIPLTGETLRRKNGDLMLLYDLLPAIAVEAYKRLHAETDTAGE